MNQELQHFFPSAGSIAVAQPARVQVREHAWYRTQNGAVIGPAIHDPDIDGGGFNWRIGDHYFSDDGKWDHVDASPSYDLVAEVEPTPEHRAALPGVLETMLEVARAEARRWWQGFTPLTVTPGRYRFGWTAANGQHHVRNVSIREKAGWLWMQIADEQFVPYANSPEIPVSLLPDGCAFIAP